MCFACPPSRSRETYIGLNFLCHTLPEANTSHLEMDGWKTSFFSGSLSSGAMLVSGNVSHIKLEHSPLVDSWEIIFTQKNMGRIFSHQSCAFEGFSSLTMCVPGIVGNDSHPSRQPAFEGPRSQSKSSTFRMPCGRLLVQ